MNAIWNSYPMVIAREIIGAKETLSKHKRYAALSKSVEILSRRMTDTEIIRFYRKRSMLYRQVKIFSGYMAVFIVIMSYLMSGSFFVTLAFTACVLFIYGCIAAIVNAERKHSHIWDNRILFSEFIKLNKSEVFNPTKFDDYVAESTTEPIFDKVDFENELEMLAKEKNNFNSLEIKEVISFFRVMIADDALPDNLQKVQLSKADFVRFIQARFINNSDELLDIELVKGDKNHVKVLFHVFYSYCTDYLGELKMSKASLYSKLYLYSFKLFQKLDYSNFKEQLARDYSNDLRRFFKMDLYSGLPNTKKK